jgi:hypothetical protein
LAGSPTHPVTLGSRHLYSHSTPQHTHLGRTDATDFSWVPDGVECWQPDRGQLGQGAGLCTGCALHKEACSEVGQEELATAPVSAGLGKGSTGRGHTSTEHRSRKP